MTALDDTLLALADPTRRGVVDQLRRGSCAAGELARALDVTPAALSRHLRILRTSGVIEEAVHDGDARQRVYQLRVAPLRAVRRWIEDVEAYWQSQLQAFQAHVEASKRKPRG